MAAPRPGTPQTPRPCTSYPVGRVWKWVPARQRLGTCEKRRPRPRPQPGPARWEQWGWSWARPGHPELRVRASSSSPGGAAGRCGGTAAPGAEAPAKAAHAGAQSESPEGPGLPELRPRTPHPPKQREVWVPGKI